MASCIPSRFDDRQISWAGEVMLADLVLRTATDEMCLEVFYESFTPDRELDLIGYRVKCPALVLLLRRLTSG
ncbi:MAG: hypothetical protein ACYS9X_16785 [Planctomycetota bacterium]|jgi:hypothetical protein